MARTSMGVDPAYGSSNFAIVVTAFIDSLIKVIYAEEFERADYNNMLATCVDLLQNIASKKSTSMMPILLLLEVLSI
jgi:hypothetical protein